MELCTVANITSVMFDNCYLISVVIICQRQINIFQELAYSALLVKLISVIIIISSIECALLCDTD